MTIDNSRANVLVHACLALEAGSVDAAKKIIETDFPFSRYIKDEKQLPEAEQMKIFMRDGFVDRFTGKRVFMPAVLVVLGKTMPDVFPYKDTHWDRDQTHQAHEMFTAAVKKIIPSASAKYERNLVTVSYLTKLSRGNATIEDLGQRLLTLEEIENLRWDGMTDWFVRYVDEHRDLLANTMINKWYTAIQKIS